MEKSETLKYSSLENGKLYRIVTSSKRVWMKGTIIVKMVPFCIRDYDGKPLLQGAVVFDTDVEDEPKTIFQDFLKECTFEPFHYQPED